MRRHGIEKRAMDAVSYLVEFVTDISMAADGTAEAKGADDRDLSTAVGWNFGFYSRAKDGATGVVLNFMGLSFLVAYRDSQFEMSLEKGEVGIKNAFGASALWDKNGGVTLTDAQGATISSDGSGNISVNPKPGGSISIGNNATPAGSVKLGVLGSLAVLVQGSIDSMGVPVTQSPAASATIVKAG